MITRTKVEDVIGKTYADKLDSPIFEVKNWSYTRRYMIEKVGCANFIAAARLARALRQMSVKSVNGLYRLRPEQLVRMRGIGEASMFVAMCILEANKYDSVKWWDHDTKFSTVKKTAKKGTRK